MASKTNLPKKVVGNLTKSERSLAGGYDLYEDEVIPEIYSDGLSEVQLGPFVVKMTLHRVEGTLEGESPPVEIRRPVVKVVMPLPSAIQMCNFVMQQIQAHGANLQAPVKEFLGTLQQIGEIDRERLASIIEPTKK